MAFESNESAFNFAVEYLKSIKISFDQAKICAINRNIDGWYHWLLAAYREISLMTEEKEDEEIEDKLKNINKMLNNAEEKVTKIREILYELHLLEIKLRKLMQSKGMVLPKKSDPRYAVLDR